PISRARVSTSRSSSWASPAACSGVRAPRRPPPRGSRPTTRSRSPVRATRSTTRTPTAASASESRSRRIFAAGEDSERRGSRKKAVEARSVVAERRRLQPSVAASAATVPPRSRGPRPSTVALSMRRGEHVPAPRAARTAMTKRRSKAAPGGQSPSRSRRRFRPAACAVPDARPRGPLARCGRALAALGLLAVALKAQPPSQGGDPQDPGARPRQPSLLGPGPEEIMRDHTPPGFRGVDRNLPIFQGFPTVVPPTFGHYPGGALPVPFGGTELPPVPLAAPPSPNAWPSWFTGPEDDDPEGFTKDVAILVQTTDYVWLRPAGEAVFVPLIFYDRYRVVRAGSEIEVRGGGQFLLTFQEGAQ